jgi:hypothetical protein
VIKWCVDMSVEAKDPDFARVVRYCEGKANAPELGSLAHFLRTAANSKGRAETSALVAALRTTTKTWPSADWLFTKGGFTDAVEQLTREYRNPAAHTALLGEEDFASSASLVQGHDALLWRLGGDGALGCGPFPGRHTEKIGENRHGSAVLPYGPLGLT